MKQGWEYKKLGEVCESDLGKTLNQSKDTGNLQPYLCSVNIQWDGFDLSTIKQAKFEDDEIDRYSVKEGDLLICEGGDTGRAAIWKGEPMLYQNALHRVRFNESVIARFALFYLRHLKTIGDIDSKYSKGVTIKHLVKSSLNSIPLPVPPLTTQQSIVSELDTLSQIIADYKEQLADYDKLEQSIFYDMFGDPVKNEKGWEVKKLGEIACEKLAYGSGASAIDFDGKTRYIRITDITEEGTLNNDSKSPSEYDDKYLLNKGDILFARSGATVGKTYLHNSNKYRFVYAGYLIRFIPNTDKVLPEYVFHYTKSNYYKAFVKNAQNAVAQPNINAKQYSDLDVCVPPLPLQQQFASKIESIEQMKADTKAALQDAELLFQSRMDYWFNA